MDIRIALRRALPCLLAAVTTAVCAEPAPHQQDTTWLRRTLVAREAALNRAYNRCHLHALRAALFAGARIELADGRRLDPVLEARRQLCGQRRREVRAGGLVVRAIGDDSALVSGVERFCAVGSATCTAPALHFAQLWTLDRGHWRIDWIWRGVPVGPR